MGFRVQALRGKPRCVTRGALLLPPRGSRRAAPGVAVALSGALAAAAAAVAAMQVLAVAGVVGLQQWACQQQQGQAAALGVPLGEEPQEPVVLAVVLHLLAGCGLRLSKALR